MEVFEYQSIKGKAEGLYKEKGSKFVGYVFPCSNEDEFTEELKAIKAEHHTARHHCYAYAFGPTGEEYRVNDDGEPSGTAGRPIHGQIRSFELSDVGIVVVRYFGGTKLGASGLIRAYKSAAKAALENAHIITVELKELLNVRFAPEDVGPVMRALEATDSEILDQSFEEGKSGIEIRVKRSRAAELRNALGQVLSLTILE